MENELLNRIMTDENYGKGLIELPEGTVVPEGNVVYFRSCDHRGGAGIMQNTIVYTCNRELSRSDDGKYYYSYYLMNEGKEINERYQVHEETVNVLNRLVRNTGLAGCGALKHNYIPGFFAPFNTPSPIYNLKLDLEDKNGETVSIPLSADDIGTNNGNDILVALFTLLDGIRSTGILVPKEEKAKEQVQSVKGTETNIVWKCLCGSESNTGNFCGKCGASRPR